MSPTKNWQSLKKEVSAFASSITSSFKNLFAADKTAHTAPQASTGGLSSAVNRFKRALDDMKCETKKPDVVKEQHDELERITEVFKNHGF